ncbi:universal stress protein [Thermomonospora cellulosilytica]|uniref:Nucleotide-binding universal stress UspA family protein n=1 Tax=Thermomonospora cellulosilytica TaxID=1411118 RepID=A0A7W3R7Q7_9ACTN|nr:universal stress protein [Thermomonospora cellulosilytica]MBA9002789.1 nucleotide-binding universal stress UspA family protein [Thermomonospora cellulosilytica]
MSLPAITVGTDGSPSAARAVGWAADEAARRRLPLRIVHVIDAPDDLLMATAPGMRESAAGAGEATLSEADKLVRDRHPDLAVTTRLESGPIPQVLREQAGEAFMLVLGHRGLGGFTSLLLGSTGLRVAGFAPGPVVIVRGEPSGHGEVLAGVDLFTDNEETLAFAFDEASLRGARLRALYAFQLAETLIAAGDYGDLGEIEDDRRARLEEILTRWRERYPGVQVIAEIVREHPVLALVQASHQADLLVVGARGHGVLQGAFLGSVSHGAIHHAHCPVAVLGPRS